MNKKAATALGTLGTGSAATATALATQSSSGADLDTPLSSTLPKIEGDSSSLSSNSQDGGLSHQSSTSSDPLGVLKDEAKKFLQSPLLRSDFAKMNLSSFEGGSDINQYSLTGTLDGRQSLVGGYNNGHYVNTESSLQIGVERHTYRNGKGKGELTGFWSYVHANKGFINFNKATPSAENGKKQLVLTGGIYFLERTNQNTSWTIKYKKEVKKTDNKFLDKSNFNKYFPKPYWYTQEGGFDKYGYNNGGFVGGAKDIDNICADDDNECSGSQQSFSSELLKWKWRGEIDMIKNVTMGSWIVDAIIFMNEAEMPIASVHFNDLIICMEKLAIHD